MQSTKIIGECIAASSSSVSEYVSGLFASIEQDVASFSCFQKRHPGLKTLAPLGRHCSDSDPDASLSHAPLQALLVNDNEMPHRPITIDPAPIQHQKVQPRRDDSTLSARQSRSTSASPTPSEDSSASTVSLRSSSWQASRRSPEPAHNTAVSQRAKHTYLHDQARQDADVQRARLLRLRLESREERQRQLAQQGAVLVAGAGRYARPPIVL